MASLFEELEHELLAKNYRYTPVAPGGAETDTQLAFKFVCKKLEEALERIAVLESR